MQCYIYYYANWIVNQVSQGVVQYDSQCFQEGLVVDKLITKCRMPWKIWKNTHGLNLNFLILRCQYVKLDAIKDADADLVRQQLFLRQVVEKYIGYTWNGVEYELFADVERPFVDG